MYSSVVRKKIPMAPILRTYSRARKPSFRITMGKNAAKPALSVKTFPMLNFPSFYNNHWSQFQNVTFYPKVHPGVSMPKIRIIVVGNTKASFLKEGESLYLKRLRGYTPIEWIEVKPEKITKGTSKEKVLASEGLSILKKFHTRDHIIVLDISGKTYSSEALSNRIERLSWKGNPLCFVIGGPLGISKEILRKANETLSLSKLTLTHEMSRILLLEQLYRAFTIMKGEKYHK